MTKLLDGKEIADTILRTSVGRQISNIVQHHEISLAIIMVGDDEGSRVYVKRKIELCKIYKINVNLIIFDPTTTDKDIIAKIEELNNDSKTFGILVQLPLPFHLNKYEILSAIAPIKDVDCLHFKNLGYLVQGKEYVRPCAVEAVMQVFSFCNIPTKGKTITIINRSALIGQPLSHILTQNCESGNATVTICHEFTKNLDALCRNSDIIISAVGKRNEFVIDDTFVKDGAVLIDIGFSRIDNKILGDFDLNKITNASLATPVPNGIGPITIACLLSNFAKITKYQIKKNRTKKLIAYTKEKYHAHKEQRLCRCGKILDRNGSLCIECHLKAKESKKSLKENKKNNGICINCPSPRLLSQSYCKQCYLKSLSKSHLDDVNHWKELKQLFTDQHVCPYTGVELILGDTASLDRVIPKSKGGKNELNNLQWVYQPMNIMKWNYSENNFLSLVKKVYEYRKLENLS